jgi:hypothetical protein
MAKTFSRRWCAERERFTPKKFSATAWLPTIDDNEMIWLERRRTTKNTTGAAGFMNICRKQDSEKLRMELQSFNGDQNKK